MDNDYKSYELYMKNRPHVVVLGAGASCAAIPNGDKYGKKISAMSEFIDKLGLSSIISRVHINTLVEQRNTQKISHKLLFYMAMWLLVSVKKII